VSEQFDRKLYEKMVQVSNDLYHKCKAKPTWIRFSTPEVAEKFLRLCGLSDEEIQAELGVRFEPENDPE